MKAEKKISTNAEIEKLKMWYPVGKREWLRKRDASAFLSRATEKRVNN